MDIFNEEILHFWTAMNKYAVKYIMVGGVATNLHGYQRATGDMDIWIDDNLSNRKKLRNAFRDYGMGDLEPLERMQFVPGWTYFHLNNGFRLDIMVSMKGLEGCSFEECYRLASLANIYDVEVRFLHINHLIDNKKSVNRPKDQLDVIELEKIRRILEEANKKD